MSPPHWTARFFSDPAWVATQAARFSAAQSAEEAHAAAALLGLLPGDRVLDAPCGDGRHALPLAAAGLRVVGVDTSPALLDAGRARASAAALDLDLLPHDLRSLDFDACFDAVLCLWGSFGLFDRADDLAIARGYRRALAPGGRLLLDLPCIETLLPQWATRHWNRAGEHLALEERRWDPLTGRAEVVWTLVDAAGERTVLRSSIHIYAVAELRHLLEEAGFSAFSVFGGLDGAPFEVGRGRLVLVARVPD